MDFNDGQSIFLQIADNLSEKIAQGEYNPGDKVPSVREMAAEMGVNPNTIMRTFNQLQMNGIIDNKRGIGYFVTEKARETILLEKKKVFFEKSLPELLKQAQLLGITADELKQHLKY